MFLLGSLLSLTSGLLLGSFAMVLIPRLYDEKKGIFLGRSECVHCKHPLGAKDLVPLLSYLLLKGKCRYCKKQISGIYPAVEIVMAMAFFLLFISTSHILLQNPTWQSVTIFILLGLHIFFLLFTFFYDLLYYEISDAILIPGIIIAIGQTFIPNSIFPDFYDALLGAALPLGIFLLQIALSRGKWLGLGDLRIGAYMGLLLGFEKTAIALIITYILGAIVAMLLLITKQATKKTPIPFGPFLVSGTIVSLFLGETILDWYFKEVLILL